MPPASPPLARHPDVDALQQRAIALAGQQRYVQAEEVFAHALALAPDAPDVLYNLGLVRQMDGRHEAAIECYRRVLAHGAPAYELLINLGNAHIALQQLDEAVAAYEHAVALDPSAALALNNLGLALAKAGRPAEAADAHARAIKAAPHEVDARLNLAQLHLAAGRLIEPATLLEAVLQLRPDLVEVRRTLAQLYELRGDIDAAVAQREAVIRAAPDRAELYRELILDLNFADGDDGGRVAAACRDWHQRFATIPATPLFRGIDPDPERRLRIGYVGGQQFRTHTLAHTMLPLIEAHSDGFEFVCYSDLRPEGEDAISERFKRRMIWRRTAELSDERFAQLMRDDRIDIAIDPVGFVGGSRLLALARRPAPLQVSFPVMSTCGGSTIDYVVADDSLVPDEALRHIAERVLRVPFAYCFQPLGPLPAVAGLPCDTTGTITFGSLNTLPKISRRAMAAWARILAQVPNSRLLIKAGFPFRDPAVQHHVLGRLRAAGVDVGRVVLKDWTAAHGDHLATYNEVDVALDSFPYCGVITTYEALSMGVPVVTRAGVRVLDRYSTAILRAVGFVDGVAADDDAYVARAVALAADRDRLRSLRQTLRSMLFGSIAGDASRVASSIEAALRSAWHDWCRHMTRR